MQSSFETHRAHPHMRPATVVHRFPSRACRARGRGWRNAMPMLLHQGSARHQPPLTCVTWGTVEPSLLLHTSSIYTSLHCFSGQAFLFHSPNLKGRARITQFLFSSVRSCKCTQAQLLINSNVVCWEKRCLPVAFAWHLEK